MDKGRKQVYILYGEEAYARQAGVREIVESLSFRFPEMNHTMLDGKARAQDIVTACETLPLMDEKRLVHVKNYEPLRGKNEDAELDRTDASALEEYMGKLPQSTVLLFDIDGNVDRRRRLYKRIEKEGVVREYKKTASYALIGVVQREAQKRGISISRDAAEELIRRSGEDLAALAGELDKFASFTGEIGVDQVDTYAAKTLEYDVFRLHGLFMQRRVGEALALLHEVAEAEKNYFGVLGLIAYQFRTMLKIRAMLDAKYALADIKKQLQLHPNALREKLDDAKKFTAGQLRKALQALSELDYQLKSGRGGRYHAETALLRVYGLL